MLGWHDMKEQATCRPNDQHQMQRDVYSIDPTAERSTGDQRAITVLDEAVSAGRVGP